MTQTQHAQHVQQQHVDQPRVQQATGEVKTRELEDVQRNSVNHQEHAELSALGQETERRKAKNRRKQRVLPEPEEADAALMRLGGHLINTLA